MQISVKKDLKERKTQLTLFNMLDIDNVKINFVKEEDTHMNTSCNEHFTNEYDLNHPFPSTRYQGSKLKILDWIWKNIQHIQFNVALDAFGGTGSVGHMLKRKGKQVVYNDILKFNHIIGKALIENSETFLYNQDINYILTKQSNIVYPTFIQDTFKDIFYLDCENLWLDMVITNIRNISNEYKQAIAWFALFQACIIKRPYNLFHRANLYVRTSDVKRSFGNKTTWDKSFEEHFITFVREANQAIFNNDTQCLSICMDALEISNPEQYDLVYIDTPYISTKGSNTDYLNFYHFLEGMLDYDNWSNELLRRYKHLPIQNKGNNLWTDKKQIYSAFQRLIEKYRNSIIVISYRSDGIPSKEEILGILKQYKSNVYNVQYNEYKYALSHGRTSEILFIAE